MKKGKNKKWEKEIATDKDEINRIIRDLFVQVFANKSGHPIELKNIVGKYNFPNHFRRVRNSKQINTMGKKISSKGYHPYTWFYRRILWKL